MTARTLVLLRHAKAESPAGTPDEQRPLSARGHVDARAAGAWLGGHATPELVLCSPSKRTRQTWRSVVASLTARGVEGTPRVRYEPQLYEGSVADLLAAVRATDDGVGALLVIGHNPTLSDLAFELDPDGALDSDGLRTCGLSVHEVDGSWRDCGPGNARITAIHTARGD